jgi:hypothetical protein
MKMMLKLALLVALAGDLLGAHTRVTATQRHLLTAATNGIYYGEQQ